MNGFVRTLSSSIGKKLMMSLTGLGFCIFLIIHLTGNLIIYTGEDAFNFYAKCLYLLWPLVKIVEIGLLLLALIHVSTGIYIFYENLRARPKRYAVKKNAGWQTIGSTTMPYTGFIILIFIAIHLNDFHFADKSSQTIYRIVLNELSKPVSALLYVIAATVVAIHVYHGFWSTFQTIGINYMRYMVLIRMFCTIFSLALGLGFVSLPVYIMIIS